MVCNRQVKTAKSGDFKPYTFITRFQILPAFTRANSGGDINEYSTASCLIYRRPVAKENCPAIRK
jgi:hypothetical protein